MEINTEAFSDVNVNTKAPVCFGRIGVLMGGPSSEREISLKSGNAILESLRRQNLDAVAIEIKNDNPEETAALIKSFSIDCAFIALHGRFGEDGQIQSILEGLKLRYTSSGVKSSSLAMDKVSAKKIFRENGLPVPAEAVIERAVYSRNKKVDAGFSFPWVIKPATHGSSIGLSIAYKEADVAAAIEKALALDDRILVEEFIKGRELTVGILENKPLSVIEIIPNGGIFDYQAKYSKGLTEYIVPAELDEAIARQAQKIAWEAHRLLGCSGCSRVDIILDKKNNPYILEVNTIPGFTATSLLPKAAKHAGIDFDQLCVKLLKFAYEKE
ncbi:MAG: D-alanine--D-alanine ligase [Candidatus Omnitrophota bacterium]